MSVCTVFCVYGSTVFLSVCVRACVCLVPRAAAPVALELHAVPGVVCDMLCVVRGVRLSV